MKVVVSFGGLIRGRMNHAMIMDLRNAYPSGMTAVDFHASLPEGDPRTAAIADILDRYGMRKHEDTRRMRDRDTEYTFYRTREYDDSDLAQAEHLMMRVNYRLCDKDLRGRQHSDHPPYRHGPGTGPIIMEKPFLRKDVPIAYTELGGAWIVLPERSRQTLESAGMHGPRFLETVLQSGREGEEELLPWDSVPEPWWELSSGIVLPPMADSLQFYDKDGKRIGRGEIANGCYVAEAGFNDFQPAYRRDELARIGPFDLALTHEPFDHWLREGSRRRFIASQRFYQFCRERNWPTDWVPVRIEK